jgi:hypothetical protein
LVQYPHGLKATLQIRQVILNRYAEANNLQASLLVVYQD